MGQNSVERLATEWKLITIEGFRTGVLSADLIPMLTKVCSRQMLTKVCAAARCALGATELGEGTERWPLLRLAGTICCLLHITTQLRSTCGAVACVCVCQPRLLISAHGWLGALAAFSALGSGWIASAAAELSTRVPVPKAWLVACAAGSTSVVPAEVLAARGAAAFLLALLPLAAAFGCCLASPAAAPPASQTRR